MAAPSQAAVVNGSSCDPNVLETMNTRGWMEGKREMEAAQILILKPDSVLEYSCFQQRAAEMGAHSGIVGGPLGSYVNSNFSHSFAGGVYAGGGTPCGAMNAVWNFLKCSNFFEDTFLTFGTLASVDPRALPQSCSAVVGAPGHNGKWTNAIAKAFPAAGAVGGVDSMAPYLPPVRDVFNAAECGSSALFSTGVVIEIDGVLRSDKTCSAPGCYYDPEEDSCTQ